MIHYKSKLWSIDKWFLEVNRNITFGQVEEYLIREGIFYDIVPAYKGCDENVIKCMQSNVTFDFANEYRLVELNEKGKFRNWKEFIENEQSNFVLNGIRLFDY